MLHQCIPDDMSENDKHNLRFLLNVNDVVLTDWFNSVDEDDVNYAMELLALAKLELIDKAAELSDLSQAQDALVTIMEKK